METLEQLETRHAAEVDDNPNTKESLEDMQDRHLRERRDVALSDMEIRHGAERSSLMFVQDFADAGAEVAVDHLQADLPKTLAFGVDVGTEETDSEYVTLTTPTDKEGTDAALWNLLLDSLRSGDVKCIIGSGQIRVHRGRVVALLDKIEAALP